MKTISITNAPIITGGLVFPVSGGNKILVIIAVRENLNTIPAKAIEAVEKEIGYHLNPLADPIEPDFIRELIAKDKYDIFLYTRPEIYRLTL